MNRNPRQAAFLLAALMVPWSAARPAPQGQAEPIKIVTTLGYLEDVAREIVGDKGTAEALANPKQDPHYVIPDPTLSRRAKDADLFVISGRAQDLWAKNVLEASGNPGIQPGTAGHVIGSMNCPVKELPRTVSRAWGDIHPEGNPHIWLDPLNIKIVAENIAAALSAKDPAGADYYAERLERFKTKIDEALFGKDLLRALGSNAGSILSRKLQAGTLEAYLQRKHLADKVGGWLRTAERLKGLKVVTYHKTYIYFADRFGLRIMGELEEKPGIPPPPKHRDAIVDLIQKTGVKIILNDNFYSLSAARYVSERTGARVVVTYIDVGASPEVPDYIALIDHLISSILEATQ